MTRLLSMRSPSDIGAGVAGRFLSSGPGWAQQTWRARRHTTARDAIAGASAVFILPEIDNMCAKATALAHMEDIVVRDPCAGDSGFHPTSAFHYRHQSPESS